MFLIIIYIIKIITAAMGAEVGFYRCFSCLNSREISVSRLPTRPGYSSFTVEKHHHSNPGKATSEAGGDISLKESHSETRETLFSGLTLRRWVNVEKSCWISWQNC